MQLATDLIRPAESADMPRIVEMGLQFWKEGPYHDQPVDAVAGARFAERLLEGKHGRILVAEEGGEVIGVLAFVFCPHIFTGIVCAQEMLWYVEPEHRPGGTALRLMWAAEKLAKECGALEMVFTAPTAEVGQIYKRFGYRQLEVAFQKRLT